jgi:hypothetical protein
MSAADAGGLECELDSLVPDQFANQQEEVLRLSGTEPRSVHRRMNDRGLAAIEVADPVAGKP